MKNSIKKPGGDVKEASIFPRQSGKNKLIQLGDRAAVYRATRGREKCPACVRLIARARDLPGVSDTRRVIVNNLSNGADRSQIAADLQRRTRAIGAPQSAAVMRLLTL